MDTSTLDNLLEQTRTERELSQILPETTAGEVNLALRRSRVVLDDVARTSCKARV